MKMPYKSACDGLSKFPKLEVIARLRKVLLFLCPLLFILSMFSLSNYKFYFTGQKTMQPLILEVNFNSDCKRACEYYPEFFNDVFSVMFCDETDGHNVAVLQ